MVENGCLAVDQTYETWMSDWGPLSCGGREEVIGGSRAFVEE